MTDNCSPGGTLTGIAGEVITDGCYQYIDYTFNVSDRCGNTATPVVVRITSNHDVAAPVFTFVPEDVSVACPSDVKLVMATAEDKCGTVEVTYQDVFSDKICIDAYKITRTFTATDECGNKATAVQIRCRLC